MAFIGLDKKPVLELSKPSQLAAVLSGRKGVTRVCYLWRRPYKLRVRFKLEILS